MANATETPVPLLDGEELAGAKQNRVNTTKRVYKLDLFEDPPPMSPQPLSRYLDRGWVEPGEALGLLLKFRAA